MAPGNPLEHALAAAAEEESARPLFYRLLLESPLLILDVGAPPTQTEGIVVLEKETQVRALSIEVSGIPHTVVFSSLAVLQTFVQAEQQYISMLGRDLLSLMRGSHIILNPGAEFGKQILPEEIEFILSGAAVRGYETHVAERDTEVRLGQPAKFPAHIAEALSAVFRSRKDVRAAYLALCAWPKSREVHLMVGIEASGEWSSLMTQSVAALKGSARSDEIVDFVPMDDSPIAQYMRETPPFYKKKLFGLF